MINGHKLVIQLQIPHREELVEIAHEPAVAGITEVSDVMNLRCGWRDRTSEYLLQAWAVDARPEPVRAHIFGSSGVVLSRVAHRELFGKDSAKASQQPVRVVLWRFLRQLARRNKIGNDLDDEL